MGCNVLTIDKKIMNKIKIGITQGDYNGCSYEMILKTLMELQNFPNIIPIIYGSPKVFSFYRKKTNLNLQAMLINDVEQAKNFNVYVINCNSNEVNIEVGQPTEMAALAAYQALEKATADLKSNKLDIIITNPVNVENLSATGIKFLSYSNFFAEKFNARNNMELLIRDELRIGLISNNPFQQISDKIFTKDLILNKIRLLNSSLKNDFAILKPKIAVLAANPEINNYDEISINILKAIEEAKSEGILSFRAQNTSEFFNNFNFSIFDAVLSFNYDTIKEFFNGEIFDNAIKYTIGFPFVHLAPINEVEYENTENNLVNENSFRNTLFFIPDLLKTRKMQCELYTNSLKSDAYAEDIKRINQFEDYNFTE